MQPDSARDTRILPLAPPGTMYRQWVDTTVKVAQLRWLLMSQGMLEDAEVVKRAEYCLLELYEQAPTWPAIR